jgi:PAS domain S-box-containing protein
LGEIPADSELSALSHEELYLLCFRNLLDGSEDRIFFKDRQGRFVALSASFPRAPGAESHTKDTLIGLTDADLFSGPHAEAALADEQHVMETGEPMPAKVERETFHDRPDAWARTTKLPLRDRQGKIVGTWGIASDVTAQVEAERELGESREQLESTERMQRVLFERNPQPMWGHDLETLQIVAVNDTAQAIYGYSHEEFLAMKITDLMPPEDVASYLSAIEPARGREEATSPGGGLRSLHHRYKDGTVVEVEVTSNDVTIDGRECRISSAQDVTERNRAAAELAIARDRAVEASNMKSAFLANISHEIRTPMNGVLGMTELLLDSDLDDDQRSLAQQVTRSGELMVELINDILDISKIEAGQLELEISDYPLHETIEHACTAAALQAQAKGVEFDVQIADAVPQLVRGDGRRLRQILLNLVSNAVKFTNQGKVALRATSHSVTAAGSILRVEVTDSGIGIEPNTLSLMFEPFTQADASTTRNYGGTGLGLAIASELTEIMGGAIGAESEPGVGSTFWVELPLAAPSVITSGRDGRPPRPSDADAAAQPVWATPPQVLVAEDTPVNQIVAVRTLERCGCQAEVAVDGRQALEMLAKRHYDAVLMDCQMPVMDGYEATVELRRRENGGHHTPVIAVTAHAMNGAVEKCLAAGMDDYISKPIQRAQLIETLRRWIPTETREPLASDQLSRQR